MSQDKDSSDALAELKANITNDAADRLLRHHSRTGTWTCPSCGTDITPRGTMEHASACLSLRSRVFHDAMQKELAEPYTGEVWH